MAYIDEKECMRSMRVDDVKHWPAERFLVGNAGGDNDNASYRRLQYGL